MTRWPGPPAASDALFPDLLGGPEPAPPTRSRGSRVLGVLARVVLWSLIAFAALRGLMPTPAAAPGRAAMDPRRDTRAQAVATAFMREYLTVGDDRAARAERLGRFTAPGVDLDPSVSLPAGTSQYADHVVASGSQPLDEGIEVTVLAHVLQVRSTTYRDGGTLAFAVPLVEGRGGVAVSGRPRPVALPVASGMLLVPARARPAKLSRSARRVARQAVVALLASDTASLARLGGDRPPRTHPLPSGWRATSVGTAGVTTDGADAVVGLVVEVPVRARPPSGVATYVVPVQVHLESGPRGVVVRHVDGGGQA